MRTTVRFAEAQPSSNLTSAYGRRMIQPLPLHRHQASPIPVRRRRAAQQFAAAPRRAYAPVAVAYAPPCVVHDAAYRLDAATSCGCGLRQEGLTNTYAIDAALDHMPMSVRCRARTYPGGLASEIAAKLRHGISANRRGGGDRGYRPF